MSSSSSSASSSANVSLASLASLASPLPSHAHEYAYNGTTRVPATQPQRCLHYTWKGIKSAPQMLLRLLVFLATLPLKLLLGFHKDAIRVHFTVHPHASLPPSSGSAASACLQKLLPTSSSSPASVPAESPAESPAAAAPASEPAASSPASAAAVVVSAADAASPAAAYTFQLAVNVTLTRTRLFFLASLVLASILFAFVWYVAHARGPPSFGPPMPLQCWKRTTDMQTLLRQLSTSGGTSRRFMLDSGAAAVSTHSSVTVSNATSSHIVPPLWTCLVDTNEPYARVWVYSTGHLRTFEVTAQEMGSFLAGLYLPYYVVMHTWTQLQHSDYTWWDEDLQSPTSDNIITGMSPAEELLRRADIPFRASLLVEIEDYNYVTQVSKVLRTFPSHPKEKVPGAILSFYYGLQRNHQLAQYAHRELTGHAMPNDTVILHIRPDVRVEKWVDMLEVASELRRNPLTLFGVNHATTFLLLSDIVFVTTKAALDRINAEDMAAWLDAQNLNYGRPEDVFRDMLQRVGVTLRLLQNVQFSMIRDKSGTKKTVPDSD